MSEPTHPPPEPPLPADLVDIEPAMIAHLRQQQRADAAAVLAAFAPQLPASEVQRLLHALDEDVYMIVRAMRDLGNAERLTRYPVWGVRIWRRAHDASDSTIALDAEGEPEVLQLAAPTFIDPHNPAHDLHATVLSTLVFALINHASARTLLRLYGLEYSVFRNAGDVHAVVTVPVAH